MIVLIQRRNFISRSKHTKFSFISSVIAGSARIAIISNIMLRIIFKSCTLYHWSAGPIATSRAITKYIRFCIRSYQLTILQFPIINFHIMRTHTINISYSFSYIPLHTHVITQIIGTSCISCPIQ